MYIGVPLYIRAPLYSRVPPYIGESLYIRVSLFYIYIYAYPYIIYGYNTPGALCSDLFWNKPNYDWGFLGGSMRLFRELEAQQIGLLRRSLGFPSEAALCGSLSNKESSLRSWGHLGDAALPYMLLRWLSLLPKMFWSVLEQTTARSLLFWPNHIFFWKLHHEF